MIPSPERLQETQLGALGVPSRGLIYWYNATNVRKCNNSYDRVVHMDRVTNASSWLIHYIIHCVIARHHESYLDTTDITTPRPPVWPHSYVSINHAASRRYGQYQWPSARNCMHLEGVARSGSDAGSRWHFCDRNCTGIVPMGLDNAPPKKKKIWGPSNRWGARI